jgi:homocitrate synthase NifV
LGKHSGTAAIERCFADMGIRLSHEQAISMLPVIRRFASEHKRPPSELELEAFFASLDNGSNHVH